VLQAKRQVLEDGTTLTSLIIGGSGSDQAEPGWDYKGYCGRLDAREMIPERYSPQDIPCIHPFARRSASIILMSDW